MFRKKVKKETYDPSVEKPVIKSSICTGEKVAGFKDINTGRFRDVMLIADERDLNEFCRLYGFSEEEIKREW